MRRNTIIFLVVGLLVITLGFFYYHYYYKSPEITLKVGIATWPGFASGYVAKEKGYFDGQKVEFFVIDDFTARQSAYITGKIDLVIYSLDSYAFDIDKGITGRAILVTDLSNGADGIVVTPDINNPNDLIGKKVAYTRGSPSHFFLIRYLQQNNINKNDIIPIEVDDPSKAAEAFLSGSVEVAVTWEPNISQIVDSGKGKILVNTKMFPEQIVDIVVANENSYTQNKHAIQKFVTGWLKASDFIKTNQAEAYNIMAKNLNIPDVDFPAMSNGLIFADKGLNQNLFQPEGQSKAIQIFNDAAQIWVNEKLNNTLPNGRNYITDEFIK